MQRSGDSPVENVFLREVMDDLVETEGEVTD